MREILWSCLCNESGILPGRMSKPTQPVEKVCAEFIEEHMSLAEHRFTPRR